MHRHCLTSRLTLSSRTRRPRFDSVQKIFLIRRDLLDGAVLVQAIHGYCIECRPIMLPSISTRAAMWPYSPINVRVPAPILSLGSRHCQMGDMCAKPLPQGRATDRVDGILGFACHVKEPRLEMDHRMHGVGPSARAKRRRLGAIVLNALLAAATSNYRLASTWRVKLFRMACHPSRCCSIE